MIGSGASFRAPIYAKWFKDFSGANKGVRIDYQSKGSGAARLVDWPGGAMIALGNEGVAQRLRITNNSIG